MEESPIHSILDSCSRTIERSIVSAGDHQIVSILYVAFGEEQCSTFGWFEFGSDARESTFIIFRCAAGRSNLTAFHSFFVIVVSWQWEQFVDFLIVKEASAHRTGRFGKCHLTFSLFLLIARSTSFQRSIEPVTFNLIIDRSGCSGFGQYHAYWNTSLHCILLESFIQSSSLFFLSFLGETQ